MRHSDEYIFQHTSAAVEIFTKSKAVREQASGNQVKRFRTDGGGEYISKQFAEYPKSDEIITETAAPYSPESNEVVERANLIIMERIR
jgi:hypothetical protein